MPSAKMYRAWKAAGKCVYCGADRAGESMRCQSCRVKHTQAVERYHKRVFEKGCCSVCHSTKQERWLGLVLCKSCFFKRVAKASGIPAETLLAIWEAQGGKDLSSGESLDPAKMRLVKIGENFSFTKEVQ